MTEQAVREFRRSNWRFVVSISGGGSAFISDYLALPGASGTFLEAVVPYSQEATDAFLGFRPENYCSERTARQLAAQARARAVELTELGARSDAPVVGIGVAASLASDRPKKGAHRVCCAVQTRGAVFSAELNLTKDARTRAQEERLAADFILSVLLFAASTVESGGIEPWREHRAALTPRTEEPLFPTDEASISWAALDELGVQLLDSELAALRRFQGRTDRIRANDATEKELRGDVWLSVDAPPRALYPGSFNPPHAGHIEIARLAAERLETPVELEISARNVDKPPIDALELTRRLDALEKIAPDLPVWLSNAPRYIEKALVFPNASFIMGTDTILRLADPKYADASTERRDAILVKLQELHVSICVFTRKVEGKIIPIEELERELPEPLIEMCDFVPEDVFLNDASSTEIRKNARLS